MLVPKVIEMYLKFTPEANQGVTNRLFKATVFGRLPHRELDPMFRYMESLQIHREYLEFFQIGVVRDQKSKIEKVAKYVGLAIPEVEPAFCSSEALEAGKSKEGGGDK